MFGPPLLFHPLPPLPSLSLTFSLFLMHAFSPVSDSFLSLFLRRYTLSPPLPLIVQLLVTKGLPLPKEATKYFKYFSLNKYILTYSDFLIIYSKIKTNT